MRNIEDLFVAVHDVDDDGDDNAYSHDGNRNWKGKMPKSELIELVAWLHLMWNVGSNHSYIEREEPKRMQ